MDIERFEKLHDLLSILDKTAQQLYGGTGYWYRGEKQVNKSKTIMRMYIQGYTLEEIGNTYDLSRERIRQIVIKTSRVAKFINDREI